MKRELLDYGVEQHIRNNGSSFYTAFIKYRFTFFFGLFTWICHRYLWSYKAEDSIGNEYTKWTFASGLKETFYSKNEATWRFEREFHTWKEKYDYETRKKNKYGQQVARTKRIYP